LQASRRSTNPHFAGLPGAIDPFFVAASFGDIHYGMDIT
jgi:hypothetical protein